MVQFGRTPIQVELGEKAVESYNLKKKRRIYKKATGNGNTMGIDYYVYITDQLREALRVDDIEMPEVTIGFVS